MLEPYIRLNQTKNVRAQKLREIDQKLSEIRSYQKMVENSKYEWERVSSSKKVARKLLSDFDLGHSTDKETEKGSR